MKPKILYVERKPSESVSIERVFKQIGKSISKNKFEIFFDQMPFANDVVSILKNLFFYKLPPADIYHITGHIHYMSLIFPKKNTVLTIHDVRILYMRKGIRRYLLKKILFDFPLKKLKYITAISETTKMELIRHTNCDAQKIRVIENPLPENFSNRRKRKFNAERPTILQIGTTDNKNVPNLVQALSGVSCFLRIIGEVNGELKALLLNNHIKYGNASGLNDSEIKDEYEDADIVSFCSTYEGFGLPIIEAQAMGKPVITSNIAPMDEVSGNAAVLVDPNDISDIKRGILQIINDEKLRNEILQKGLENIERFEPEQIAKCYEDLYLKILDENLRN